MAMNGFLLANQSLYGGIDGNKPLYKIRIENGRIVKAERVTDAGVFYENAGEQGTDAIVPLGIQPDEKGELIKPELTVPADPQTFQPDLQVESVQIKRMEENIITYECIIRNVGRVNLLTSFTNRIVISEVSRDFESGIRIEDWEIVLGPYSVPFYAGSSRSSGDKNFDIRQYPPGDYYLAIVVDINNNITESDETNNTGYDPAPMVHIDLPDLVGSVTVTDAEWPEIGFDYIITNQGVGFARQVAASCYLSADFELGSNDHGIKMVGYFTLSGDESVNGSTVGTVPATPSGYYYLLMDTDHALLVGESNEYNNLSFDEDTQIYVPEYVDLFVYSFLVLEVNGLEVTYDITVNNWGNIPPPGNVMVRVYCSEDYLINPDEDYRINEHNIGSLGSIVDYNTEWESRETVTVSGVPPGDYYIGCYVDPLNSIEEFLEINNAWNSQASGPEVHVPHLPTDLQVESIAITDITGPIVSYECVVRNAGNENVTTSFTNRIVLSGDTEIDPYDDEVDIEFWEIVCDSHGNIFPGGSTRSSGTKQFDIREYPSGDYYLGVILDIVNHISESDETNNTGYDPDPVVHIGQSDLVGSITVTDAEWPEIGFDFTITNQGVGRTGWIESEIRLSTDLIWSPDDYSFYLGSGYLGVPGLPGERSYDGQSVKQVPSIPSGDYYLLMNVDVGGFGRPQNPESNEDNNICFDGDTPIYVPEYIDLKVNGFWALVFDNIDVQYQIVIKNEGSVSTPDNVMVRMYCTEDHTIVPGEDYVINEFTIGPLGAYRDYNNEWESDGTITVSGVPPGDYYIGCYVDPLNDIEETSETNNVMLDDYGSVIHIPAVSMPDLVVREVVVVDHEGPDISYQVRVKNQGDAQADAPFTMGVYLSGDQTIQSSDYHIDSWEVTGALAADASVESGVRNVTVSGVPNGDYYLGVIADVNTRINESDEGNNTGYDAVTMVVISEVTEPDLPDLVVQEVVVVDHEGPDISYQVRVKNQGDTQADAPFTMGVYLSGDQNIQNSDYHIDSWEVTGTLAADASVESGVRNVTVSGVPNGDYYLGVIADVNTQVNESDEGNNTGYDAATMVVISEVTEPHWADMDGDGDVDIVDVQMIAGRWNTRAGDPNYLARCDVDGDGDIDIVDLQMVAALFGQIVSGPADNMNDEVRR
jgi:subtilase family serine protease